MRHVRTTRLFDERSPYLDRFGALLALTIASVVVASLIDLRDPREDLRSEIGLAISTAFVGGTFLLALRTAGVSKWWGRAADLFVWVAMAGALVILAVLGPDENTVAGSSRPSPFWLVLAVLSPLAVIRRLLRHRRVTVQTLLGALSGYLLFAVAFFYIFLMVDAYQGAPFFGVEEPTTSFMYFSLVAITTLGFGDLSPTTDLARLVTTTAAVVGQIYLVTVVAMVVGLLAQTRAARPEEPAPDGLPPEQ